MSEGETQLPLFFEVDSYTIKNGEQIYYSWTNSGGSHVSLKYTSNYYVIEIDRGNRGKYVTTSPVTYISIESFFTKLGEDIKSSSNVVKVTRNKEDLVYDGMLEPTDPEPTDPDPDPEPAPEITLPSWAKKVDSYTMNKGAVAVHSRVYTSPEYSSSQSFLKFTNHYYAIEIDSGNRGTYVTTKPVAYGQIESFVTNTLGENISLSNNRISYTSYKDDLVYEDMVPIIYVEYVKPSYVSQDELGGLINIPEVEGLRYRIKYTEEDYDVKKTFNETLSPGEYQLRGTMEEIVISVSSSDINTYIMVEPDLVNADGTPNVVHTKHWYDFKNKDEDYMLEYMGRGVISLYDISSGEEVRIPPEEYPNFIKFKWGSYEPEITSNGMDGRFYKDPYPYGLQTVKVTILNSEYIFVEGIATVTKTWNSSDNQRHYRFYDTGNGKTGEVEIARWGPVERDAPIKEAYAGFKLYIKKGTVGERKEVVAIPPLEWGNNEIYMYAQEGVEYYNARTGEIFKESLIKVPDSDNWRYGSMSNIVYATEEPFVIAAKTKDPSKFILKKPEKPPINYLGGMPDENPYAKRAWEYIFDSRYGRDKVDASVGWVFNFVYNGRREKASTPAKYMAVWVNDVRIYPEEILSGTADSHGKRSIIISTPRRTKNSIIIEFRDPGSFIGSIRTSHTVQNADKIGVTRMTYGYRAVLRDSGQKTNYLYINVHGGEFRDEHGNIIHVSWPNPELATPLPGYIGGSALIPAGHPLPPPDSKYWYYYSDKPFGYDTPIFDKDNPNLPLPPYIKPFPDPNPDIEPEEPDSDIPPGVDDVIIPTDPVDPDAPPEPEPDPVYPDTPPPEGTDKPVEPAPVGYTRVTVKGNASVDVYNADTKTYLTTITPSVPRLIRNGIKYIFRAYSSQGYTFSGLGKYRVNKLEHAYQQLNNDHTRMRDLIFVPYGSLGFVFDTIRIIEGNPVDTIGINNVYLLDEDKTSELSFDIMVNREATIIVDPRTHRVINANLTDYIINLLQIPFKIPSENIVGEQQILLGLKSVNTTAPVINKDSITIDLGKVTVPGKYNNSYDYSNTSIVMHLPYHNPVPLDANYALGHEVGVKYIVNLYTGQTTINITSSFINNNVILSLDTMIGNNIPFIDPKIVRGVLNDNNIQPVLNNNTPTPMIEVTRNIPYQMDSQFNKDIRTTVEQLGSESGYVYIHDIDIEIDTTREELDIIKSTLASGIIIK